MYPPNTKMFFVHNNKVLDVVELSFESVGDAAMKEEQFMNKMKSKFIDDESEEKINPSDIETYIQYPSKYKN